MEWFDVTPEQVLSMLAFAARSLDPPHSPPRRTPPRLSSMRILFEPSSGDTCAR